MSTVGSPPHHSIRRGCATVPPRKGKGRAYLRTNHRASGCPRSCSCTGCRCIPARQRTDRRCRSHSRGTAPVCRKRPSGPRRCAWPAGGGAGPRRGGRVPEAGPVRGKQIHVRFPLCSCLMWSIAVMLVQPALENRLGGQVLQPFQNHGSADEAGEHHGGGKGLHEQHHAERQRE